MKASSFIRLLVAFGLMTAWSCAVQAQLSVAAIRIDGKVAESAPGVIVRLPGAEPRTQSLSGGASISPGTELTLPRGTTVELVTSNGNRITIHPGARFMAGVVSPRGESHQPLGGRMDFSVRKSLDFFNVQYDRILAAVKGTEFTTEVDPSRRLTIAVRDGVVQVEREGRIAIDAMPGTDPSPGPAEPVRLVHVAESVGAGENRSYALDVEEYLAKFRNFAEAEAFFRKALSEAEAGKDRQNIARAVRNLMEAYNVVGKPQATLELERRCTQVTEGLADRASCLKLSGDAHYALAAYKPALDRHEEVLDICTRFHGRVDHPCILDALNDLGIAHIALGNKVAWTYLEQALAMEQRLYGRSQKSYAAQLCSQGHLLLAAGVRGRPLDVMVVTFTLFAGYHAGRDHPDVACVLYQAGEAYRLIGEYQPALDYFVRSVEMGKRLYGSGDHPAIALTLQAMGNVYYALKDRYRAGLYYGTALAMQERLYMGRDHPDTAVSLRGLGNTFADVDAQKSVQFHTAAVAMWERLAGGRPDFNLATGLTSLGVAQRSAGDYDKAIAAFRRALSAIDQLRPGADSELTANLLLILADTLEKSGTAAEAKSYRDRGAAMRQRLDRK